MKRTLENHMTSGKIISFHCECDPIDINNTGRIMGVDNNCFIICDINQKGYFCGLKLYFIKDVLKTEAISIKYNSIKILRKDVPKECEMVDFTGNIYKNLLTYIKNNALITSLGLDEKSFIRGSIGNFDENNITLKLVDENGDYNGRTVIACERVRKISIYGSEEIALDTMIKKRKMFCRQ